MAPRARLACDACHGSACSAISSDILSISRTHCPMKYDGQTWTNVDTCSERERPRPRPPVGGSSTRPGRRLERGPVGALRVDEVAREAGVARSTVYVLFGSRAGLFDALARHLRDEAGFDELLAGVPAARCPPGDARRAAGRGPDVREAARPRPGALHARRDRSRRGRRRHGRSRTAGGPGQATIAGASPPRATCATASASTRRPTC